jgi:hypothetical protein
MSYTIADPRDVDSNATSIRAVFASVLHNVEAMAFSISLDVLDTESLTRESEFIRRGTCLDLTKLESGGLLSGGLLRADHGAAADTLDKVHDIGVVWFSSHGRPNKNRLDSVKRRLIEISLRLNRADYIYNELDISIISLKDLLLNSEEFMNKLDKLEAIGPMAADNDGDPATGKGRLPSLLAELPGSRRFGGIDSLEEQSVLLEFALAANRSARGTEGDDRPRSSKLLLATGRVPEKTIYAATDNGIYVMPDGNGSHRDRSENRLWPIAGGANDKNDSLITDDPLPERGYKVANVSADGRRVITVGDDGQVRMWNWDGKGGRRGVRNPDPAMHNLWERPGTGLGEDGHVQTMHTREDGHVQAMHTRVDGASRVQVLACFMTNPSRPFARQKIDVLASPALRGPSLASPAFTWARSWP